MPAGDIKLTVRTGSVDSSRRCDKVAGSVDSSQLSLGRTNLHRGGVSTGAHQRC
jgi:hypothetical protein